MEYTNRSYTVTVVHISYSRSANVETWITSDGRAYFVQLVEMEGSQEGDESRESIEGSEQSQVGIVPILRNAIAGLISSSFLQRRITSKKFCNRIAGARNSLSSDGKVYAYMMWSLRAGCKSKRLHLTMTAKTSSTTLSLDAQFALR